MSNKTQFQIESKFAVIKTMFDEGDYDIEQFDYLTKNLINILGGLTEIGYKGDKIIEGIKLDLWKDRVFYLIERAGLLPDYKDKDKDKDVAVIDVSDDLWYGDESEFGFDEDEFDKSIEG